MAELLQWIRGLAMCVCEREKKSELENGKG